MNASDRLAIAAPWLVLVPIVFAAVVCGERSTRAPVAECSSDGGQEIAIRSADERVLGYRVRPDVAPKDLWVVFQDNGLRLLTVPVTLDGGFEDVCFPKWAGPEERCIPMRQLAVRCQ